MQQSPADGNSAQFNWLDPIYLVNPYLECYLQRTAPTGVTACTLHLSVPSGDMPTSGFDVTALAHDTIETPTFDFQSSLGQVSLEGSPYVGIALDGLYPPAVPDDESNWGIDYNGVATTPAEYGSGSGVWDYVQIITPDRTRVLQGQHQSLNYNGSSHLDNWYPYSAQWAADNTHHHAGDKPSDSLYVGSTPLDSIDCYDTFQTYLMYQPPGDSSFVPLAVLPWYWHGSAHRDENGWILDDQTPESGSAEPYPDFPEWSDAFINGDMSYSND